MGLGSEGAALINYLYICTNQYLYNLNLWRCGDPFLHTNQLSCFCYDGTQERKGKRKGLRACVRRRVIQTTNPHLSSCFWGSGSGIGSGSGRGRPRPTVGGRENKRERAERAHENNIKSKPAHERLGLCTDTPC